MTRAALIIPVLFACLYSPTALESAQQFAARAEAYLRPLATRSEFMGAVLVARDGDVLFEKAYGLADAEWSVPNSTDTKFEIASLTKQFTAMAILQLVAQGKLRLDDPVPKFYPESPAAWEKVTVHHLLTHTSGIPNNDEPADYNKGICATYKPLELIATFRNKPLKFAPGTDWAYTNTEYYLLGYIIERLSSLSYGEYLLKNIFAPAGMKDSGYLPTDAVVAHMARGYKRQGSELRHGMFFDRSLELAAGGIHTTVHDMLRWDQVLYTEKLLDRHELDLMFTPHPPGEYGYGWFIRTEHGRVIISHEGGDPGFTAYEARFPQDRTFLIVLSNFESSPVRKIADDLATMLFGREVGLK
jgi:CubicO group peptidase (beta-lactamase class C family)